ncbi:MULTISPECIES: CRISPR-associated endonuclease Cas3'' [unclassified Ectothiorhodospira]|uniref:CRISPR-associated endonuclease Cas3'' n=1 Tax=unclassified Ectothiorhodospira TaxID=2684909 RepID=UPI001EE806CD|nr:MULTISPECIES: CRISPR-associated endonuclease Cas3'' [unclassified Ectothiorhodospira]MCG5517310.1 CRISPR-associated endonuclease Cas3'' [Ectothiorhodospira sp. 9100]MCG5520198.1 CRISPR-associated endonuclease Cas3'' [Ectothiorhodospira sp. 9905]
MPVYFAHSTETGSEADWQRLSEHLIGTSRRAEELAKPFGGQDLASVAGLLHDLGKYTEEFQERIRGGKLRVDHATRGAMIAAERFPKLGHILAYGIAGHHAGLANGIEAGERTPLRDRLRGIGLPELASDWRNEISLPKDLAMPPLRAHSRQRSSFQLAFLVRMLFSCLVDADYLDTEQFYDRVEGLASVRSRSSPSLNELRSALDQYLMGFKADSHVNRVRNDVLNHVRHQATSDAGVFSLTVPTGGGKTLVSLAFALDHAIQHGLSRVIFVIPFTSIVEQNAAVFRSALGEHGESAVLEHHSAFVSAPAPKGDSGRYQAREKLRLAMENWDAPIIVTTAVQFFESLFAARPSQCRKLHNIAGSVVILDEAQTLPLKLLRPTVAAIDELARNYRTSVVLCTATQPALNAPDFRDGLENVRELAPDPAELFRKLERVRVRHIGTLEDEELTAQLRILDRVLCIVNNRRHARAVYQTLADLPGTHHLTTLMCAKHRSQVLNKVRDQLRIGEPCRLISTSLIEAGVDISLPTVYRAEAGLDSIAQAAGRCNRNGERPADQSEVRVFATANDDWVPPPELRQFAQAAQEVLRQPQYRDDPLSPAAIEAYFRLLYWQKDEKALDTADLLGLCAESRFDTLPLETLATKFRMIDTVQMPVIVPFDDHAHGFINDLRYSDKSGALARKLQPYLVQLPCKGFDALRQSGAIQPIAPEKWGEQFMALVNMDIYSPEFGIWWDEPTFMKSANTII